MNSLEKKGVIVTARVHPGETNSSWMMRGLLSHITGPSPSARVCHWSHCSFCNILQTPNLMIIAAFPVSVVYYFVDKNEKWCSYVCKMYAEWFGDWVAGFFCKVFKVFLCVLCSVNQNFSTSPQMLHQETALHQTQSAIASPWSKYVYIWQHLANLIVTEMS